ncbi:MAG: di-trans,poly-cis-decaprenylcistransferase [Oscillospiraceae bacterium]|jgi:undecaprenyl diphosphate synthase|nr:di-trans,poly-cis-decaprenylcistransferase [Oscillospiraceae bacterium]
MGLFRKKEAVSQAVPTHIAIVMDGNGRWARKRGLPRKAGHKVGAEAFRTIANYAKTIGLKYLTVYAFSTENWKRADEEVHAIMQLLEQYLREAIADMDKNRVRFCFFGDLTQLSPALQEEARIAAQRSKRYEGVQVNFCLNYGGRVEIVRAAQRFARDCVEGKCAPEALTQEGFSDLLYSSGVPDPELVIRPGGELRTSNFLLWQSAYAEYYFTDVLWPDFGPKELDKAIAAYNARNRRFGGAK